jgi:hypothetical protein
LAKTGYPTEPGPCDHPRFGWKTGFPGFFEPNRAPCDRPLRDGDVPVFKTMKID